MSKWVNKRGFSLMEVLVAMVIAGIVMAAIYAVYYSQQKSYVAQEQIAAMQQNLRVAMYRMEREIRMAGCDPTRDANDAGITTATANSVSFREDIRGDAEGSDPDGDTDDPNEAITYSLVDNDGDGDNDLERNANLIAENIDTLNFVYLGEAGPLDDDGNGNVVASIPLIRSIQIALVARTGRGDPGYTDTKAYYNQQDLVNPILPAQNDNVRRRPLTAQIRCRNLGL